MEEVLKNITKRLFASEEVLNLVEVVTKGEQKIYTSNNNDTNTDTNSSRSLPTEIESLVKEVVIKQLTQWSRDNLPTMIRKIVKQEMYKLTNKREDI